MEPLDSLDNSLLSTFTGEVSQCVRAAITVNDGIATNLHCKRLTPPIRASVEHGLSWAVAGRSEGKLQAVLDRAGKAVAADLSSTPVIVSSARLTLYIPMPYIHSDCRLLGHLVTAGDGCSGQGGA